jgi:RNA polymerase sigma-70 factor (ECF subfamily)
MNGVAEGVAVIFKPSESRISRLGDWYVGRYDALLRFAYFVCRDAAVAEDLVQESFVRVFRAGRHAEEDGLDAYAKRAIVNLARSGFRRVVRERRALAATPLVASAPPHEPDAMWGALAGLSPQQRACVALRFYESLSEAETAAVLGVSVGTVKKQTSRAFEKLRATLGEARES